MGEAKRARRPLMYVIRDTESPSSGKLAGTNLACVRAGFDGRAKYPYNFCDELLRFS